MIFLACCLVPKSLCDATKSVIRLGNVSETCCLAKPAMSDARPVITERVPLFVGRLEDYWSYDNNDFKVLQRRFPFGARPPS